MCLEELQAAFCSSCLCFAPSNVSLCLPALLAQLYGARSLIIRQRQALGLLSSGAATAESPRLLAQGSPTTSSHSAQQQAVESACRADIPTSQPPSSPTHQLPTGHLQRPQPGAGSSPLLAKRALLL